MRSEDAHYMAGGDGTQHPEFASARWAEHGTRWTVLTDPEGNEFCVGAPSVR